MSSLILLDVFYTHVLPAKGSGYEKPPPGAESRLIDFEELINSLVGVADLNKSLGVADRWA